MKFVWRFLFLSLFLLFVGFVFPNLDSNKVLAACASSTSTNAYCDVISAKFTNSSGNTLNIFYRFLASDISCTTGPVSSPPISENCVDLSQVNQPIWSLDNGSFATRTYSQNTNPLTGGYHYKAYYVWWWATYAANGATCVDPVVATESAPFVPAPGANYYSADINVTCSVPPAPPVSVTPASNLNANASCESSTSVRASFSWTPATASGTTIDQQWLDFALVNPPDPGGYGFQNRNVVGTNTYSESGFPPNNVPIYWKINTHTTNGQWYPSTVASFTTPDCRPELISTLDAVPDLVVGGSYNFKGAIHNQGPGNAGASFARFCVALVGINQDCFNNSPRGIMVGGVAHNVGSLASQAQQSLTSAAWQPQDAGDYKAWLCADVTNAVNEQIETNNCASKTFTVTSVPVPACSPSNQSVNVGQAANLSASRGNGTYSWSATGGSPSSGSGTNFSVSYSTSGAKTVTVTSGGQSANCSVDVSTGITLWGSSDCSDGVNARVHLNWSIKTSDTQFNVVRGSTWVASTTNRTWDSGPETQGQRIYWTVIGVQSNVISNSLAITTATCPPPSNPPPDKVSPCPPKGDLNDDGVINIKDLDLFGSFFGQTSAYHLDRADVNGSGTITGADNLMIGNYISGAISTFPCGSIPPPVTCTSSSPSADIGQAVEFKANGGNGTYSWSAPGGSPSSGSGTNILISYSTSGTKTVTVTSSGVSANCSVDVSQPTGIRLSGSRTCPDANTVRFNLSWTATTGDTQFNIVRNGVPITSLFGNSFIVDESQSPSSVIWNVYGLQTGTLSNTVRLSATCVVPPSLPDIQSVNLLIKHLDGNNVIRSNPAQKGERLRAEITYRENNNITVNNFNAGFWQKGYTSSNPACNPAGPTATFRRLRTSYTTPITITTEFTADAVDGTYQAWYFLDNDCRIDETANDNNVHRRTYYVGAAPVDIAVSVKIGNQTSFAQNDTANFTFTVSNRSAQAVSNVQVGFWPKGAPPAVPNCPGTSANPPIPGQTIGSLPANGSQDVTFGFNVGPNGGTFTGVVYAIYDCAINDSNWSNNSASQTYAVGAGQSWIKTTGGDVGAKSNIDISYMPAGEQLSTYLAASGGNLQNARGAWNLSSYTGQLTPPGLVYSFFATRFMARAQANTNSSDPCNIAGGGDLAYCSHSARYDGGAIAAGASVWFIEGDLTIVSDLKIGAGDTVVLIASGNITVETGVRQVDAVLVAGGEFRDCSTSCGSAQQLLINGAVYAGKLSLSRMLSANNDTLPAVTIVFAPKYIDKVAKLIGSPSIQWAEVAP